MTNPAYTRSPLRRFVFTTKAAFALVLILASGRPAHAQSSSGSSLSNLTLSNFFTEGWDQDWAKRPNPDGAPDMALLRVSTNFLEREFRTDFYSQQDLNSKKNRTSNLADALIAYGLDRRFMVSVTSNYQWINSRANNDMDESNWALGTRLQLVDIPGSSYAFNVKVTSPAKSLGNDQTTVNYNLAGWEDLTPYGLSRVGLYFSVGADNFVGPHPIGTKSSDTSYDVSLAKTWTEPTAALGNFTTFAELFGTTDLSGATSGKTVVTLTPGIRTGIGHNQVIMLGVDLPVSHPRQYNFGPRLTYIINF
jgi:hypothetical protein